MAILAGFIAQVAADRLGDIGPFQVDTDDNLHSKVTCIVYVVLYVLYACKCYV